MEGLKAVPDSVVYQHTHRYLYQHQFWVPGPPNDFAYWIAHVPGNEELGERLAAVDPVRFSTLAELREAATPSGQPPSAETARTNQPPS